ncbi:hypothetical protein ACSBR2_008552 [Camellia fascicularis]
MKTWFYPPHHHDMNLTVMFFIALLGLPFFTNCSSSTSLGPLQVFVELMWFGRFHPKTIVDLLEKKKRRGEKECKWGRMGQSFTEYQGTIVMCKTHVIGFLYGTTKTTHR